MNNSSQLANGGEVPNGRPPRSFGLWISLALLIIGVGIGGAGGWRLVGSLYDEATQKPLKVFDIEPGEPIRVTDLQVDATRKMQLAVQLRLPDSDDFSASVEYQYPFRYQLLQTGGGVLFEQQGSVASDQGLRISRKIDQQQGKLLEVEHRFQATQVPFPGLIDVEFLLEHGDLESVNAAARQPLAVSLLVYEGVSTDVRGVIIGGSLVLLGSLVGLVGLILVLVHAVGSNKVSSSSATAETNPQPQASDHQIRNLAMWCHLSALSGFIVPFGNVLGPLVIWLSQREKSPFIDEQGKEAVNFQLSLLVYSAICALLILVLVGILLLMALGLGALVLTIIAALQANQGVAYRYPLIIRFIR